MAALNGRLPLNTLVHIGTDHYGRAAYLTAGAAASWARMRAAGMPFDISDSYRDFARQKRYEKNPPNGAGLAAPAGTSSHGWGRAVDARGACLTWLARYGAAHGWVRTIMAEPWHFEYIGARDTRKGVDDLSDYMQTPQPRVTNPSSGESITPEYQLQIAGHYAYRGWEVDRRIEVAVAALTAQVTNLLGAVAALNKGESFDQAKLRAGIRADFRAELARIGGEELADAVLDSLKERL